MADLTVTWKGAVQFEAAYGQNRQTEGKPVVFDAAAMAAGFDIRPAMSGVPEMALRDAVPYMSEVEGSGDFDWDAEYSDAVAEVTAEVVKPKRGRPVKG